MGTLQGWARGSAFLPWASSAWGVLEGAKDRMFGLCHHDLLPKSTPTTPPFQEELPHFPVPAIAKRGSCVLSGVSAPSGSLKPNYLHRIALGCTHPP